MSLHGAGARLNRLRMVCSSNIHHVYGYMRVMKSILLCLGLALPALAYADVDQRAARAALKAGEIRPLTELLAFVDTRCNGDLIEIELERGDAGWYYEIKLLGPESDINELEYHAHSFALIEAEGRNLDLLECVPEGTPR
jgi:hypothetical protein